MRLDLHPLRQIAVRDAVKVTARHTQGTQYHAAQEYIGQQSDQYAHQHGGPNQLKHQFVMLAFALIDRSEEHTSELQSLMPISYAVFCFKQKIRTHSI